MTKATMFWLGLLVSLFLALSTGSAAAAIHLGAPARLWEGGTVGSPAVGVDEAGATSIAWTSFSAGERTLRLETVAPDGKAAAVKALGTGIELGQLAVAPAGAVTAVGVRWPQPVNGGSEIVAARVAADGTVEPLLTLFSKSGWYSEEPQVAIDPLGDATVVWRSHQLAEVRIEAVQIGADGVVGPTLTLAEDGIKPQVAVDPQGRATVVWGAGGAGGIEHLRISASGIPGAAATIPGTGEESLQPALAVDSEGRATVVWRDGPEGDTRVDTNRIDADGTAGTTQTLSAEPLGILVDPIVAIDGEGRAWVAWSRQEGEPEEFLWSIQVARIEPFGTARAAVTVSGPEADHAQIAPGPLGYGWIAWDAQAGSHKTVQIRRLPDGGPSLGQTETLPAGSSNDYSPVPVVDAQGDLGLVWREVGTSSQNIVYARGENVLPETTIDAATWQPETTFAFSSPDYLIEGFECALDGGGFGPCASPVDYGTLTPGHHEFAVRARDEDEGVDPTPATSSFEIPAGSHASENPPAGAPSVPTPSGGTGTGRPVLPIGPIPGLARHGLAVAAGPGQIKGSRVLLRIRCVGASACEGLAVLVGTGAGRGARLGQARFALGAHKTAVLPIPLTAKTRRLLADGGLTAARIQGAGISAGAVKLRRS
jgi:hypothetical protein